MIFCKKNEVYLYRLILQDSKELSQESQTSNVEPKQKQLSENVKTVLYNIFKEVRVHVVIFEKEKLLCENDDSIFVKTARRLS